MLESSALAQTCLEYVLGLKFCWAIYSRRV